ncbi:MAG: hypothetical protein WCA07_13915, partial [Gloeobacterales cyanobacterium]
STDYFNDPCPLSSSVFALSFVGYAFNSFAPFKILEPTVIFLLSLRDGFWRGFYCSIPIRDN